MGGDCVFADGQKQYTGNARVFFLTRHPIGRQFEISPVGAVFYSIESTSEIEMKVQDRL